MSIIFSWYVWVNSATEVTTFICAIVYDFLVHHDNNTLERMSESAGAIVIETEETIVLLCPIYIYISNVCVCVRLSN